MVGVGEEKKREMSRSQGRAGQDFGVVRFLIYYRVVKINFKDCTVLILQWRCPSRCWRWSLGLVSGLNQSREQGKCFTK